MTQALIKTVTPARLHKYHGQDANMRVLVSSPTDLRLTLPLRPSKIGRAVSIALLKHEAIELSQQLAECAALIEWTSHERQP